MGKTNRNPVAIGEKYGRLLVIEEAGRSKDNRLQYKCRCDCGNLAVVIGKHLKTGNTKSCGCYKRDAGIRANTTHGLRKTKLYGVWADMKDRCYKERNDHYKYYGLKGIEVCDEWKDSFVSFYDWAMSNGYKEGLTIDRIDVNGNYCPENCRWATMKEQANNKQNNVILTFNGETHTLKEWSEIIGVNYYTLHSRYSAGRSTEEILSKEKLKRRKSGHAQANAYAEQGIITEYAESVMMLTELLKGGN